MLDQLEQQEVVEEQRIEPQLVTTPTYPLENDQRQRRRMVIALILLLVALGLVLVKDRDFWFPSTPDVAESDSADESVPVATSDATTSVPAAAKPAAPAIKKQKGHIAGAPKPPATGLAAASTAPPPVTATRAVLPPLRIEVVAGDRAQTVRPGSPSVKVDLQPTSAAPTNVAGPPAGSEVASAGTAALTNAGERVQMSTDARQALAARPVRPEYPLLARQMKVQGAVVLDALIGKDGAIQTLKVVGGPSILADAAREAVKQWRFKPYYQDGQPVETQARITVNFSIFTN
jgi:protein TonB